MITDLDIIKIDQVIYDICIYVSKNSSIYELDPIDFAFKNHDIYITYNNLEYIVSQLKIINLIHENSSGLNVYNLPNVISYIRKQKLKTIINE